jgi:hypothetical protein
MSGTGCRTTAGVGSMPESQTANGTFAPGYGTLPPGTQAFAPQEPPSQGSPDDKIPF